MKKTQRKDAVRNIRKRIVSYLSVCLVVMLGLGGAFTTRYMNAGLDKQATDYYEAHNFKDYDLVSSYGISEANLEKIKTVENVTDAEGAIQMEGSVSFNGQKRNAAIISLTERVSVPDVMEGKYPPGRNECIIGEDFAEAEGLHVGDTISISLTGLESLQDQTSESLDIEIEDADGETDGTETKEDPAEEQKEPVLYEKDFTVTGLMHHPDHLRRKSINTITLPLSAFNEKATEGLYTNAFVRINEPENTGMFTEAFFDKTEETRLSLEKLSEELAEDRTQEVKDKGYAYIDKEWAKAEAKLNDAQDEIDSGEDDLNAELAKARKKLEDARKQLDKETAKYNKLFRDGDRELANGEKKIADAKKQLADAEKELAAGKKKLDDGKKLLAEKEKELEDGKKKLEEGKEKLQKVKDRFGGDEEIDELYVTSGTILEMTNEIDKLVQDGAQPEVITEKVKNLGQYILDHKDEVKKAFDLISDPELMKELVNLQEDGVGVDYEIDGVNAITAYGYDAFIEDAKEMSETGDIAVYNRVNQAMAGLSDYMIYVIDQLRAAEEKIKDSEQEIADGEKLLEEGKEKLKQGEEEYNKGVKELANAKAELAEGERELNAKKKELKDGKAEFAAEKKKAEKKIGNGWNDYYEQKERYENKLQEAVDLLATNRAKAEEKLAEARAEVEDIDPCQWIVLDRKGNAGYVDIKSNIDAVSDMGILFGLLFTIITAIVCLSTLIIIIDEQKTLVGTVKAFGFHKGEVLGKYLVFGVSAAVIGSILAAIGAILLSDVIQERYAASGMYPIGVAKSIITPVPTLLFSLLITAVTVAATVIACSGILRSPASMLMKGAVLKREKKHKQKTRTASKGGTLYSRLIIRNMLQDKARVLVTIAIIGFSCMLMGMGISMKYAYDGMMNRQISDVNRFDVRMDMNSDVSDEDEQALVGVLEKNGVDLLPATAEATLYRWNGRLDGVNVICADPERIGGFYGIIDPKTGKDIPMPENGVLIQKRMHESYGMNAGDTLPVLDSSLKEHDAEIAGTFINYVGRTIVMSPETYRSVFGEANDINCYYIKLNGADLSKVEKELLAVSDNVSFVTKDEFKIKFESGTMLYNVLILITTGLAILISFMILTNLANIYLTRKKTELTIMRVNGFSIKETKRYLSKESIVTTLAGLVLGVVAGALITPLAIRGVQQPDLEFVKSFQVIAWVVAVGLEALFSLVINTTVFRKVKNLNLRDIA